VIHLATDLTATLLATILPAARALGIVVFLPGLGGANVPPQVRLLIAGGIAVLAGGCVDARSSMPQEAGMLAPTLFTEIAFGLIVGWSVLVFLESVRWAGEILDMQIGLRMGQFLDPVSQQGSSLLGQVYYMTALTCFFVLDGHHWVLAALGRSFERVPIGAVCLKASMVPLMLDTATSALDIAVRLAAAGLASLLLADIALAIIARTVPQMNVFLVGIPAKIGIGLVVLAFSIPLAGKILGTLVAQARHIVMALAGGG